MFTNKKLNFKVTFYENEFYFSLSLSLSLATSLLHAEDNGFFVSAGYQIGEAVQMVKNTGELKTWTKIRAIKPVFESSGFVEAKHSNGEQHSGCQQCFKRFKKLCE